MYGDIRRLFCLQAEDGVRDVERSRGLGDVYKGQLLYWSDPQYRNLVYNKELSARQDLNIDTHGFEREFNQISQRIMAENTWDGELNPVFYTHMTLPTICSVEISVVAGSLT